MKKQKPVSISHEDGLIERLKNPEFALLYLNEILRGTDKGVQKRFLEVMGLIARAHGMSGLSRRTNLQRESLRKALSEKGNPRLSTLFALLKAFDLRFNLSRANEVAEKPLLRNENRLENKMDEVMVLLKNMAKRPQSTTDYVNIRVDKSVSNETEDFSSTKLATNSDTYWM